MFCKRSILAWQKSIEATHMSHVGKSVWVKRTGRIWSKNDPKYPKFPLPLQCVVVNSTTANEIQDPKHQALSIGKTSEQQRFEAIQKGTLSDTKFSSQACGRTSSFPRGFWPGLIFFWTLALVEWNNLDWALEFEKTQVFGRTLNVELLESRYKSYIPRNEIPTQSN